MPDQYINRGYIEARFSDLLVDGLTSDISASISLDAFAQDATAAIKTRLKNSGYARPSTASNPPTQAEVDAIDPYIKMATFGIFWELISSHPSASLSLPEGWDDSPYKTAINDIMTGAAQLDATPDTTSAVGGAMFTSRTDSPQQFSRTNLEDY